MATKLLRFPKPNVWPSGYDQTVLYIESGEIGALHTIESIFVDAGLEATLRADVEGKYFV